MSQLSSDDCKNICIGPDTKVDGPIHVFEWFFDEQSIPMDVAGFSWLPILMECSFHYITRTRTRLTPLQLEFPKGRLYFSSYEVMCNVVEGSVFAVSQLLIGCLTGSLLCF